MLQSATDLQAATVILKLKPEFRVVLSSKQSGLVLYLAQMGIDQPKRKFPNHQPVRSGTSVFGKALTDLSLIYQSEVPEPFRTAFLLSQLKKRPEFEYVEWELQDVTPLSMPNDPSADSTFGQQRQVLKRIQAYQAWNLSQGDSNVVIGVLDTGIPVDHEDMVSQIKVNPLDPPNGLDDDQNGLIDDYRGWDFGSNDNNPTPDNNGILPGHGTSVASLAGAASNNAKGVAGIAWKCKVLPIKIWKWAGNFSNFKGYEAIVYAADMGCKIINCSWGSSRKNQQYEQDIINYATFNKNSLIVSAGGNSQGYYNFLPANYDYVLGVTMTDTTDQIVYVASQNFKLDLSAPGVNVFGIKTDGSYGWVDGGSSMASPIVAGAAALVRSKFPELSGIQAGELLRVNSDTIYSIPGNESFRHKAGKGRLNIYKALQKDQSKSIRAVEIQVRNNKGLAAQPGDTVAVYVRFENYLDSLPGFQAKAISTHPDFQFITNNKSFGPIGTLKSRVEQSPFIAVISPLMAVPVDMNIRIDLVSGNYSDQRWFDLHIDQRFIDLDINEIQISAVSNARFGYTDASNSYGSGIRYKSIQYCGEAGLMVGTSASKVSNSVYDTNANDQHFQAENKIKFTDYSGIDQHTMVHLNDSAAGSAKIGLGIKQTAFELLTDSLSGTVFINYQITNRNSFILDSVCIAQYNDWDVENYNRNFARWIDSVKTGYTQGQAFRRRMAATQVLSPGEPQFYAIEALPNTTNGNINLFDGFSLAEKWKTISSGVSRIQAGSGLGNNVVQVTGVKIRNLAPGETRKVTFAYLFADSLPELVSKAKANRSVFRKWNTSPSPQTRNLNFCVGDTVDIETLVGVKRISVFADSLQQQILFNGTGFSGKVYSDSTLFVTGQDSIYGGPLAKWSWKENQKPLVSFSAIPVPIGDSLILNQAYIFPGSNGSTLNQWSINGNVSPQTSDTLTNPILSLGSVDICLVQTDTSTGCSNQYCKTFQVYQPVSVKSLLSGIQISPNPAIGFIRIVCQGPLNTVFMDLSGKTILSKSFEQGDNSINVEGIPSGLYLLKLKGPGFTKVIKVRKE